MITVIRYLIMRTFTLSFIIAVIVLSLYIGWVSTRQALAFTDQATLWDGLLIALGGPNLTMDINSFTRWFVLYILPIYLFGRALHSLAHDASVLLVLRLGTRARWYLACWVGFSLMSLLYTVMVVSLVSIVAGAAAPVIGEQSVLLIHDFGISMSGMQQILWQGSLFLLMILSLSSLQILFYSLSWQPEYGFLVIAVLLIIAWIGSQTVNALWMMPTAQSMFIRQMGLSANHQLILLWSVAYMSMATSMLSVSGLQFVKSVNFTR